MSLPKEEMMRKLSKRLPNYLDIIEQLQGDEDGLRMCGHEKEIDHIVQKFSLSDKSILEICTGIGICGILLARQNIVHSYDINPARTKYAQNNARLFNVEKTAFFHTRDVCEDNFIQLVTSTPEFVFIDCDWRADMLNDARPNHSPDPFETCPKADDVFRLIHKNFPGCIIAYKVSSQSNVERFRELGECEIVSFTEQDKIKFFHVYFYPNPTPSSSVSLDS